MSRIWENATRTTPSYTWAVRSHVVDIRDEANGARDVSVRAEGDNVVLTLPIDVTTDLEVTLSRDAARRIGAAVDDASGQ